MILMLCGAYTEMTVQSCRSCDICCSITSAVRPLFIINNFINNSGPNLTHSDLRDYISDTTRSFRGMHAWRLTRFISR